MRFRRASDVSFEELDGYGVLLDRKAVRMLTLNPVGTMVWELLGDDRTSEQLAELLLPKVCGVTSDQLEADIASFLDELVEAGVVITSDEP